MHMELKVGQLQLVMRCAHPAAENSAAEETRIAAAVNFIFVGTHGSVQVHNHKCMKLKCQAKFRLGDSFLSLSAALQVVRIYK